MAIAYRVGNFFNHYICRRKQVRRLSQLSLGNHRTQAQSGQAAGQIAAILIRSFALRWPAFPHARRGRLEQSAWAVLGSGFSFRESSCRIFLVCAPMTLLLNSRQFSLCDAEKSNFDTCRHPCRGCIYAEFTLSV
jgi:hypothetical protein